jgi:DNA recombination protein RmuC
MPAPTPEQLLVAAVALLAGALVAGLVAWGVARHARRVREAGQASQAAQEASFREVFQSLAVDALAKNSQLFFEQARAGLGEIQQGATAELAQRQQAVAADLAQRQQAIDALVAPIKDSLALMGAQLAGIEKERHGHYASLTQQLRQVSADHSRLQTETASLVRALRHAPARGRWGELQLRRVVELAGMLEHCDFTEQETFGVEKRLRPDLIVKLPGGKSIVVDAKAPLEAYLDAHESADDGLRETKLKDHARQVRQHVTALGAKQYWAALENAPDFVVLFLPGEPFFSAALQYDSSLVEYAVSERVMIASPTTLISLLRTVHYGWQQERIAEEAQRISALGRELYERLATLGRHFEKVGGHLDKAVGAYNEAVGSLENRVLVSARRFKELGATAAGTEITELAVVERASRKVSAPELGGGEAGDAEADPAAPVI